MRNPQKVRLLEVLRGRFGELGKLPGSQSLFTIGDNAARIYVRYSRVHPGLRTFFGLREIDLRQLEGHNAFLCFLLDDGSPPVFIPYADFEEVFRGAEPAKDGQFKAQLISDREGLQLYVAKRGRFNVESYVGFGSIEQALEKRYLRESITVSHSQVQTLLAGIGHMKGYDVYVPENDKQKLDWSLTKQFTLRPEIPAGFDDVKPILSEVDTVWVSTGSNDIEGLFEVEHSTAIYSGLLRFNDVFLTNPKVSRFSIVSNETRRAVFSRQIFRPTFRKSGLAELVSFLHYANVLDWHARLSKGKDDEQH